MAAPAGYRAWSTADLVSASDFSTYVQDQIVGVYTSSSNRSSELASPAEGQVSFLTDTNVLAIYDGSAWVDLLDVDTFSVSSGNYAMTGTLTLNSGGDTFSLPTTRGSSTNVLQSDGDGTTSWVATTVGDITGLTAGTLVDITAATGPVPTVNVDLSEASTSTSDADGDYFLVTDAASAQYKLTKANIALSGMNNDSGWTTNVGDVTGVTAGTNIDVSSATGPVPTVNLAIDAAVVFGSSGSGVDTTWHSGTASDQMAWSEANVCLTITGTDGQDSLTVADGDVSITDDLTVSGTTFTYLNVLTDSTTTRTPALTDAGAYILTTHGTGITVTLPQNTAVAFPVGTTIYFERNGAGTLTFAAGTGATVTSKDSTLTCADRYTTVAAIKIGADAWSLIGNIG
jgi:hypothetical protein